MKQFLFIGLGNPGAKYQHTRHNLGIRALRSWVNKMSREEYTVDDWRDDKKINAEVAKVHLENALITCLFPTMFMNKSGQSAQAMFRKRLSTLWRPMPTIQKTLILHDDLELSLGALRFKQGGSARGHNGVRSIHQALGTQDIPRLLLGIGPKPSIKVADFVLGKFSPDEEVKINQLLPNAHKQLDEFLQ